MRMNRKWYYVLIEDDGAEATGHFARVRRDVEKDDRARPELVLIWTSARRGKG